jgi:hypothetical protein
MNVFTMNFDINAKLVHAVVWADGTQNETVDALDLVGLIEPPGGSVDAQEAASETVNFKV